MPQVNINASSPSSAPASATSALTTAPQVFFVASYATLPSFSTGSARASLASLPAASHHSPPVQVNLQTNLAAVQQAVRHLQPLPAVSLAPCSSSTPFSPATSSLSSPSLVGRSSTHSAVSSSPSSLPGGSVSFPSFIPTVCAALGSPFASSAVFAGSAVNSTTPTPSVFAPVFFSPVYNFPRLGSPSPRRRRVTRYHAQLARDSTSAPVGH